MKNLKKYLPLEFIAGFIMATLVWEPGNKYLPAGFIILALLISLQYFYKSKQQEQ